MANDYVIPIEVISPKRQWTLVSILYDRGENQAAVAMGLWEDRPVLAMRWNGGEGNPIGNPQSRGLATWFIVPDEFKQAILSLLQELAPESRLLAKEYFMNAIVLTNTIPLPDVRKQVQEAVLRGIGQRIDHERWTVKIFAPADRAGYVIRIQGPNRFTWEHDFEGPGEETPAFIEAAVREATQ
jgi:hypothetical protein